MSDALNPACELQSQRVDNELVRRPVVALGYQAIDGTIVVTAVLCANFPDMTNQEAAALSFKLDQWAGAFRRRDANL